MLISQAVYVTCSKWKVKMFTWQKCVPQMHKPLFMFQSDVDQNKSASFAHMVSTCVCSTAATVSTICLALSPAALQAAVALHARPCLL